MSEISIKCPYCKNDALMISVSDRPLSHILNCTNKECDGNGTLWYCPEPETKLIKAKERIKSTITKYYDVLKRLAKR